MPCYDPPGSYGEQSTPHLQTLTRLSCEYCHALEKLGQEVPSWAIEWWTKHKENDRIRKEREVKFQQDEVIRKAALGKLTAEELKLLRLSLE